MKRKSIILIAVAAVTMAAAAVVGFVITGRDASRHADVDRSRFPVKGIDISAHNGQIDFAAVAADTVAFAYIKATEGLSHRDSLFASNARAARAAGLKVGAYHFFRFNAPGSEQARNLLEAVDTTALDLPLAIDVEEWGNAADFTRDDVIRQLRGMVSVLRDSGRSVVIYTNKNGYGRFVRPALSDVPLWICSITTEEPEAQWTFWQHSHSGTVRGIRGSVDLNTFSGDTAAWGAYLRDVAHPPAQ